MTVVEVFDTQTGEWSVGPALPEPRAGNAAAVVAGRIFVFGGENLSDATVHSEVFEWVPTAANETERWSGAWVLRGNLPKARHGLAGVSGSGKVFALGGGLRAGLRTPFALSADVAALKLGE